MNQVKASCSGGHARSRGMTGPESQEEKQERAVGLGKGGGSRGPCGGAPQAEEGVCRGL